MQDSSIRTTRLHLASLGLIALLAVAAYVLVGQIVRVQEATAHLVAMTARQVVLSQRIAGLCVELASHASLRKQTPDSNQLPDQASDDAKDLEPEKAEEKTRDDLRQAIALMQVAHQALINGSDDLKLAKPTALAINKVYFGEPYQLDHQALYFLAAANAVAAAEPDKLNPNDASLIEVQLAARERLFAAESAAASACGAEGTRVSGELHRWLNVLFGSMLLTILADLALALRVNP